ncbi:MAG: uroporphyrinogen-III C-methyltransferase [Bacteroidota bacterium]|nr:uroporphyrinogen-III C-methyltransferase [Bacteroidota bacterium]
MNSLQRHTETKPLAGKVILAGAGCGDPELITVKAARYLQEADVVLTDRLVSNEIIRNYVSERAEVIYVGKQCRRGYSTPQASINELIVAHALKGKMVVRLKGGDASVFSNILDELEVLTLHHIPFEIIPGITAATGAAAYAGIPLTARGYSTAVRFLTLYKSDVVSVESWQELAQTNDTLVFYMSSETLDDLAANLCKHGISEDKKLAVVEQATTPFQKVYTCSFSEYANQLRGKRFISPSLVIIGKVVNLHAQFNWKNEVNETTHYFTPVGDIRPVIAGQPNTAKHVSRA